MQKKYSNLILIISVFTLIAILLWIYIEIFRVLRKKEAPILSPKETEILNPKINEKIFEDLKNKSL